MVAGWRRVVMTTLWGGLEGYVPNRGQRAQGQAGRRTSLRQARQSRDEKRGTSLALGRVRFRAPVKEKALVGVAGVDRDRRPPSSCARALRVKPHSFFARRRMPRHRSELDRRVGARLHGAYTGPCNLDTPHSEG